MEDFLTINLYVGVPMLGFAIDDAPLEIGATHFVRQSGHSIYIVGVWLLAIGIVAPLVEAMEQQLHMYPPPAETPIRHVVPTPTMEPSYEQQQSRDLMRPRDWTIDSKAVQETPADELHPQVKPEVPKIIQSPTDEPPVQK